METKKCTKCANEYEATTEFFWKFKQAKDGLHYWCKPCAQKWNKERYYRKREERIQMTKDWRERNLEHRLEYEEQYHKENKKEIYDKNKKYREKNKEKLRESSRRYYEENKDKIKSYIKGFYQTDRGRHLRTQHHYNRKRHIEGSIDTLSYEDWQESLANFNNECAYCGRRDRIQRDHVVPLSKNGHNNKQNIIPACIHCNSSKNDSPLEEWYPEQECYSNKRMNRIYKWTGIDKNSNSQQIALF